MVKGIVCRPDAHTCEALIEALEVAISAISVQGAQSFFEHCGYDVPACILMTTALAGVA